MAKFYVEVDELLTWSMVIDVPDDIAADPVTLKDYIYENWGECEGKDLRGESDGEIVTLEPYSEK